MVEQAEQVEQPEVQQVNNPALIRLVDITNGELVVDMNYYYYYYRVFNPQQQPTNYFILHYKEKDQEQWNTCKGLLSKDFTVAKTDLILQQLKDNLGGITGNEKMYRSGTSVKSSFTLTGFDIDVEEDATNTLLFKLLTNIDSTVICDSKLSFNVINGFSGNHALQLNFGLLKILKSNESNYEQSATVNNVFLLDKYTKRIIHDNRLSINIQDITEVQQSIASRIDVFKRYKFSQELINQLASKSTKSFYLKLISLYEMLPDEFKTFYYVSYILSSLLDSEQKIILELKMRRFIDYHINLLQRQDAEARR